jgi:hypothetical protein
MPTGKCLQARFPVPISVSGDHPGECFFDQTVPAQPHSWIWGEIEIEVKGDYVGRVREVKIASIVVIRYHRPKPTLEAQRLQ